MTHSGGKPHTNVGDRGQRYELRVTGYPKPEETVEFAGVLLGRPLQPWQEELLGQAVTAYALGVPLTLTFPDRSKRCVLQERRIKGPQGQAEELR